MILILLLKFIKSTLMIFNCFRRLQLLHKGDGEGIGEAGRLGFSSVIFITTVSIHNIMLLCIVNTYQVLG